MALSKEVHFFVEKLLLTTLHLQRPGILDKHSVGSVAFQFTWSSYYLFRFLTFPNFTEKRLCRCLVLNIKCAMLSPLRFLPVFRANSVLSLSHLLHLDWVCSGLYVSPSYRRRSSFVFFILLVSVIRGLPGPAS